MVIESYTKVPHRIIYAPYAEFYLINGEKNRYRLLPETLIFHVVGEYWYDGVKFYIGSYNGAYSELLVEATTFMRASNTFSGKKPPSDLIKQFKENLLKSQKTIHETINFAKLRNLDLEAWTNFLIT